MIKLKLLLIILCLFLSYLNSIELIQALPENIEINMKKALLGKKLFQDKRLSSDNTISCSSCHNLKSGGADNKALSYGINNKKGLVNSPSVFNSSLNFVQMWDGRVDSLSNQVSHPIVNVLEMNTNFRNIIKKLSKDKYYTKEFKNIYKTSISKDNIIDSIVEFEKSLLTYDSRFDKYLNGDLEALNKIELEGYELFKKRSCISCHNGVNIGGNLFQKFGILKEYKTKNKGRYLFTKNEEDKYVFKVPSLRNIELTAPYLHSGKIKTLEEVISIMYEYQLGIPNNSNEIDKIIAFLKTLTGNNPKIMSICE